MKQSLLLLATLGASRRRPHRLLDQNCVAGTKRNGQRVVLPDGEARQIEYVMSVWTRMDPTCGHRSVPMGPVGHHDPSLEVETILNGQIEIEAFEHRMREDPVRIDCEWPMRVVAYVMVDQMGLAGVSGWLLGAEERSQRFGMQDKIQVDKVRLARDRETN